MISVAQPTRHLCISAWMPRFIMDARSMTGIGTESQFLNHFLRLYGTKGRCEEDGDGLLNTCNVVCLMRRAVCMW